METPACAGETKVSAVFIAPGLAEMETQEWQDRYVTMLSQRREEDYILEQLKAS